MPAWLPIVMGASALYNAYRGNKEDNRRRGLEDEMLRNAREDRAAQMPYRQALSQSLLGPMPEQPNLSSAYADPSNPFYREGSRIELPRPAWEGQLPTMQPMEQPPVQRRPRRGGGGGRDYSYSPRQGRYEPDGGRYY